jgi:hypothetical protein
MRVRDWQDILEDVVESKADPKDWRAVGGKRRHGLGEDLFVGHPEAGVFHLKTYAKNPFEVKGVGSQVARRLDDELDPLFPTKTGGRFGIQPAITDEETAESTAKRLGEVIRTHADAPTTPDALFEDVMEAMDSPAFGPMEFDGRGRPTDLDSLSANFEEAEDLLTKELDDLIDADEVGRGFH